MRLRQVNYSTRFAYLVARATWPPGPPARLVPGPQVAWSVTAGLSALIQVGAPRSRARNHPARLFAIAGPVTRQHRQHRSERAKRAASIENASSQTSRFVGAGPIGYHDRRGGTWRLTATVEPVERQATALVERIKLRRQRMVGGLIGQRCPGQAASERRIGWRKEWPHDPNALRYRAGRDVHHR